MHCKFVSIIFEAYFASCLYKLATNLVYSNLSGYSSTFFQSLYMQKKSVDVNDYMKPVKKMVDINAHIENLSWQTMVEKFLCK